MSKKRLSISIAVLMLVLTLTAEIAVARSVLRFRPPSRGTPTVTRGGASRGTASVTQLQVLAPTNRFGLTTAAYPTLLVYVPKTSAKVLKVGLRSPDGRKTLFKREIAVPQTPGIMRIQLGDVTTEALQLNQEYRWYVALFSNEIDRSTNTIVEGRIARIQPDANLTQRLNTANPTMRPFVYADAGIWWDTVLTLDHLRQQQPNNVALNTHWKTLLESVGLGAIAAAPRVELK